MVNQAYLPPFSEEAEQAVLGAIFIDATCMDEVARILPNAEMFWRVSHQHIYRAVLNRPDSDWLTVVDAIEKAGQLEHCGGREALLGYLSAITHGVPSAYGAERYALIVRDRALKREIALAAGDVRTGALDVTKSAHECIADLNRVATELAEHATTGRDEDAATVADKSLAIFEAGGIQSMSTGYQGLDKIGGGFVPGGFYVVAARPGEGKSALIGNMIERYQRRGVKCGVIPLEMTNAQMMVRLVAVRANLNSRLLREAKITGDERQRAIAEWRTLRDGIWFNDKPAQTVVDVAAQARAWKRKRGIDILFVDYLQIMGALDPSIDRRLQIGEMTRGLKQLASELQIPVLAACQINREAESRRKADGTGGRPGLHNLKESGTIEEDADGVIGIYRPLEPKPDAPTWAAEIGWMKNRHGGIGHVAMAYHRASTRFTEATDDEFRRDEGAGVSGGANGNGRHGAAHVRGNADVAIVGGVDEEQRRKNLEAFGAPRERKDWQ